MVNDDDPGFRKFNDLCESIDSENDAIEKSRQANYTDSVVELNDYMRPRVLSEMNGTVYRPYVNGFNSNKKFKENYDKIDWSK